MRKAKIIPVVVATLVMGSLLIWGMIERTIPERRLSFEITNNTSSTQVEAWHDKDSDCYYLFLPSYAKVGEIRYVSKKTPLILEDSVLDNGFKLPAISPNKVYNLMFQGDTVKHKFAIIQSANVATMFVDIDESMLIHVNKNPEVKASSEMTLLSPNGKVLYDSAQDKVKIKSHGHSTLMLNKKSYTLILNHPDSLLGMAAATKWVLLANGFDESNLKNKIVYDFAKTLDYCWSPSCEFVDLYINHVYHGLYLLSEKVELADNRLHLDDYPQYLFKLDLYEPQGIQFYNSTYAIPVQGIKNINLFQGDLENLKNAILDAPSDTCHQLEKVMDIHSWACKYMLDQLFLNTDMWYKSNFFYCTGKSPFVFYGGPIWDYDLAWRYPATSFMQGDFIELLIQNADFRKQVVDQYTTAKPYLNWLMERGIDSLAELTQCASTANSSRWQEVYYKQRPMYDWVQPSVPSPDSLKTFLNKRIPFLDRHWVQNIPFSPVYIQMPISSGDITIEYQPGLSVSQYIEQSNVWNNCKDLVWIDQKSGQLFYPNTIIDTIVSLLIYRETNNGDQHDKLVPNNRPSINNIWRQTNLILFFVTFLLLIVSTTTFVFKRKKTNNDKTGKKI